MTMQLPRILALSPTGETDPGVVVAGTRAGGLGVFDFGRWGDEGVAREATVRASRILKERPLGIRVPHDLAKGVLRAGLPENVRVVIVTDEGRPDWPGLRHTAEGSGRVLVAEVTSRHSASAAAEAGAGALILAGNEAGGRGGEDSTFIFLQAVAGREMPPVWVRGGIGPRSASACVAAGAAGVVLDGALLLARESPLDARAREQVARLDGGETVVLGRGTGSPVRVFDAPGGASRARLAAASQGGDEAWARAIRDEVGWRPGQARPVGQDGAFADGLARRFVTVGGIVQEVERAIDEGLRAAVALRPLAEGAPLAASHGTRYPIVQGPMTRVSDTVPFAEAVADGGALPLLALALMRGTEVRALLEEAQGRLAGRPWGVGVLGFVPPELRKEQVAEILRIRPPFALIAGGRPDQAVELERAGIATYLHVPSPGLLRQFWRDGSRRFVLEGRECGGHVGPRSSLVLWEQAAAVVLDAIGSSEDASDVHLLFAGGIHDDRSTAAVAALAAPLAERGVRVGVLIGSAYLFTAEAVATGAIVPGFQSEALRCARTVLLETGPGHEVRVSPTPFAETFESERRRLIADGRRAEELRAELEGMNTGRLRVAAKGVDRSQGAGSPLVAVDDEGQKARGLYMLGQAATLRDQVVTIASLHEQISAGGTDRIERLAGESSKDDAKPVSRPSDIAIVGMSAIVPGASDVRSFWQNTLQGRDAIVEVPEDRWDWRLYYDPDPKAPDKITSKWGGFVPDIPFDPLRYGMPPTSLTSIEPMQLLTLEAVRAALDDAGYRDRPFPRERTAVVLGAGGGAAQLAMGYAFRSYLPLLDTVAPGAGREALERCGAVLPEWTEDSFPGILLNVAAGRVANRFDLGGANYTVDAACGSSLAAAALAVRELESGAADMVVLGGADTVQNPFTYLAFSKTHAFSPKGRCRPFDAGADGIVISEAVAVLVLKRLADAERDGDRIYAVIKGLGAGSDGRAKGLTAPRPEGQVRALKRAYEKSGVSPTTIGYVEAHGTGTAAGDLAEVQSLTAVFEESGAGRQNCAVGSVKSLIGHTKCAAGLAGLINASLALYHEVLPPTIGVETPNPKVDFSDGPFYISTQTRPWLHDADDRPRRAGVSAFGFGGTNFHAVLEAYQGSIAEAPPPLRDWPAELLVWRADRDRLLTQLDRLAQAIDHGASPSLLDLAGTLASSLEPSGASLAIVATTLADLRTKLDRARQAVASGDEAFHDPRGIDFAAHPDASSGRLAFLFPGQGAQRPDMLGELAVAFPELRRSFESSDRVLRRLGRGTVSHLVFPPPAFDEDDRRRQRDALAATEVAQPALGSASVGLLRVLDGLGVVPEILAGHSFGELVALHAAGVYSAEALAELAEARGRFVRDAAGDEPGAMAALAAGPEAIEAILDGLDGVAAVNWNGPSQTVISGTGAAVDDALARARERRVRGKALPVACAFHSPLVASAREPLADLAGRLIAGSPRCAVFSNVTAAAYPDDPAAIAAQLGDHVARPVQFAAMIEAIYGEGVRTFVEVGPGSTLSGLVGSILGDRQHLAVACEPTGRPGIPGFLLALGRLFVAGVGVRAERLTGPRAPQRLDPVKFRREPDPDALSRSAWVVNGSRVRPASGPEPARLGPGPARPQADPGQDRQDIPTVRRNGHVESPSSNGTIHRATAPRPPAPVASEADVARMVESFQQTMQMFLEVQRQTMLGLISGQGGPTSLPEPPVANGRFSPADLHRSRVRADHIVDPTEAAGAEIDLAVDSLSPEPVEAETAASESPVESMTTRLLTIVRERTGYPAEMLRLDLDLEADLGIDSIKRIEILGTLRDSLPGLASRSDGELMDQLAKARTLGAIVERVSKAIVGDAGPAAKDVLPPPAVRPEPRGSVEPAGRVRRRVLEAVEVPAPRANRGSGLAPGGLVIVTDDGAGVARILSDRLRAQGHPAVLVAHGSAASDGGESADLTSPAAVEQLLDRIRVQGNLAGIVHALPLGRYEPPGLDPAAWAGRMGPEVRGIFLLARGAAEDLARAAEQGGACLLAATAMGGGFASVGGVPDDFFPGHGAVAGLVKTLAREWPRAVRVRVIDLDPSRGADELASRLDLELAGDDPHAEVGYLEGRRVILRAVDAPVSDPESPIVAPPPGAPILITGGARGITAAVAADLARRWRPTLLLLGSSPLPVGDEDAETASVHAPAELKTILHRGLAAKSAGPVGPADLERAYRDLLRRREILANLGTLRESGATVDYTQADVRDREALKDVLDRWRNRYGPVVGLVHGAGVIQDKLLRDKTPESFDRVLATKLEGALNLAGLLDPEALRFVAFFSSVAGRFGNRGQADYAAANEALNKLAIWLDRRWSGRVVSAIWGPWSGVGMVSDLEGHLGRRGLKMIAPGDGAPLLGNDLEGGRKGEVEVVLAGDLGSLEEPEPLPEDPARTDRDGGEDSSGLLAVTTPQGPRPASIKGDVDGG